MISLEPSAFADTERLIKWIENDPYHRDFLDPVWWLTGVDGSLLSYRLDDSQGPLCYVRLDPKEPSGLIRLHTQFGPREEVTKLRLVKGMLQCIPNMISFAKSNNASGIIFQSVNPSLIEFMKKKFNFQPAGGNDYVLLFQVGI